MTFDFNSRRSPVLARNGMVASSQPLATMAGIKILLRGGNAADAAIATAAALNVTEPHMTGLGGDCFALFYNAKTKQMTALNGSGRAPAALSIDLIKQQNLESSNHQISDPNHAHNITVPGACAGWCDLIARHGTMPLRDVLAPAIQLAEDGFPVMPLAARGWNAGAQGKLKTSWNGQELTISGRAPRAGEIFQNPGLAQSFRVIAEGGKDAYYRGDIARAIVEAIQKSGGVMTGQDLADHASTWDEPISTTYRGVRVWECPPNGQGLTALIALNILEGFDLRAAPFADPLGVARLYLLIEVIRAAFADAQWYVADPKFNPAPLAGLLSKEYAAERRALINPQRTTRHTTHGTPSSNTVYLCVVDRAGNGCSFINSNYASFGSGIVPQGCGFVLQNRGHGFTLDPNHPNALAPRKRPYHTIIPGMITREADGSLYAPFGVKGTFMQPQGHVQVVVGMIDDDLDPQAALNRPRFRVTESIPHSEVKIEEGVPFETLSALAQMGHTVIPITGYARVEVGTGQIIRRDPDGTLWGGSEPRSDGCAIGI
ncbi:MAG: gamma-glutamyltransferase [Anaerolineales bacterium]|nr:gamma-glutamyltransferase [Anaerolineales bacterium]